MINVNPKSKSGAWLVVGFTVAIAMAVAGSQLAQAQQAFDAPAFKQEVEQLQSFAREEILLVDQFNSYHIPQTYFVGQTKQIDDKVLSFYQQLHSSQVSSDQRQHADALGRLVFDFSRSLQAMAAHPDNLSQLSSEQQHLNDLLEQFNTLYKEST